MAPTISPTLFSLLKLTKFSFVKIVLSEIGCLRMLIPRCDIVKILESLQTRPLDYLFLVIVRWETGMWSSL